MLNLNFKPTNTNLVLVLSLAVAVYIAAPFVTIWALNTLFPALAIEYTFQTWLAALILFAGVTRHGVTSKNNA